MKVSGQLALLHCRTATMRFFGEELVGGRFCKREAEPRTDSLVSEGGHLVVVISKIGHDRDFDMIRLTSPSINGFDQRLLQLAWLQLLRF